MSPPPPRKPYLDLPGPWLVAHRGGAALAPENTLAAFELAASLGADAIETDVRLTADGVVAVVHDGATDRTTGVPGTVEGRRFADLAALDAGATFTPDGGRTFPWRGRGVAIPSLAEALRRHPRLRFNVEAKSPDPRLADELARTLRDAGAVDRVCVGAADDVQSARLRALLPDACHFLPERAATCHVLAARGRMAPEACPGGFDVADLPLRTDEGLLVVDPVTVAHFHARGMAVFAWTVDAEEDMRALLALGVRGIMTDRPDLLARVMGRTGRAP